MLHYRSPHAQPRPHDRGIRDLSGSDRQIEDKTSVDGDHDHDDEQLSKSSPALTLLGPSPPNRPSTVVRTPKEGEGRWGGEGQAYDGLTDVCCAVTEPLYDVMD